MGKSIKTGTKEWAERSINLFSGKCLNNCIYCYAHANIARFNLPEEFTLKEELLGRNFRKRDYLTMYPSSHDIRPEDIHFHIMFLSNFLKSGSNVLIVTKPFLTCIEKLTDHLQPFRKQIEFRFTIGSTRSETLKYYEPDAPDFAERIRSLTTAYFSGYKTSISIEPMLDTHPEEIIERVQDFVTGDIWIGKMNHAARRLSQNGHNEKRKRVEELAAWQNEDQNILNLVRRLSMYPQIRWKDSIQKVIDAHSA